MQQNHDSLIDHDDLERNIAAFQEMIKRRNIILNDPKTVEAVPEINILGYNVSHNSIKPDPERLKPLIDFPAPNNVASLKRALGMLAYYARWIPQFSDKIRSLAESEYFPLMQNAISAFEDFK